MFVALFWSLCSFGFCLFVAFQRVSWAFFQKVSKNFGVFYIEWESNFRKNTFSFFFGAKDTPNFLTFFVSFRFWSAKKSTLYSVCGEICTYNSVIRSLYLCVHSSSCFFLLTFQLYQCYWNVFLKVILFFRYKILCCLRIFLVHNFPVYADCRLHRLLIYVMQTLLEVWGWLHSWFITASVCVRVCVCELRVSVWSLDGSEYISQTSNYETIIFFF